MKFILISVSFLLLFCTSVFASNTALIYHSNYSDAHTNVKTQLEADGYTVTLSTTGTVHDNLYTNNIDGTSGGYDVVYDMKYNNSIGSNGKTRYQNFVQAGGVLVLVGENNQNFSNNNQTIEAFIENKLGEYNLQERAVDYVIIDSQKEKIGKIKEEDIRKHYEDNKKTFLSSEYRSAQTLLLDAKKYAKKSKT